MKAIYNSGIIQIEKISVKPGNRGFRYGDGFFETIVTGNTGLNLIPFHLDRLFNACQLLNLNPPAINAASLAEMIQSLKTENGMDGNTRTRLQVWRNEGGLYQPISKDSSFLMEINQHPSGFYEVLENVGVSNHSKVVFHRLSFAKTISALPYIVASLEKKEKGLDEIFIRDALGNVAESTVANVFWVKGDTFYTPDLQTGCIAGVMRSHLLRSLPENGFEVKEVFAKPDDLMGAESIFTTNAAGIRWVRNFRGKKFQDPSEKLSFLLLRR